MRPDLIRLLVDKTPKAYIVDANSPTPDTFISTLERLGLSKPLAEDDK
jgi:cyanide hydratase